ncbi:MAG: immunity 17 family protein [Christensenellaceae bacterium]|jgi:hypothetical protein|nr:immunity 17 family protein [Christensenellaceae bacterium]
MEAIGQKVETFLFTYPGLVLAMLGGLLLLGAIFDWQWVVGEKHAAPRRAGLFSFFLRNGSRKTRRVLIGIASVLIILFGVVVLPMILPAL